MKKVNYLLLVLVIGLFSCNSKSEFGRIIPPHVNEFATEFIQEIHNGNIDSCLVFVQPEMNTSSFRQSLRSTTHNIKQFDLDSNRIVNASKTNFLGKNDYTKYWVEYEYPVEDKYLYFTISIKEENEGLLITSFNGSIIDDSLSSIYVFTFKGKGFIHYLILSLAIFIPVFIIISLIFAIRTKLKMKWLWIIGILFGFMKISINWATGQIAFSLISISILGAGISKSGLIAPWIVSLSIPVVAIIFWIKRRMIKKKIAEENNNTSPNSLTYSADNTANESMGNRDDKLTIEL